MVGIHDIHFFRRQDFFKYGTVGIQENDTAARNFLQEETFTGECGFKRAFSRDIQSRAAGQVSAAFRIMNYKMQGKRKNILYGLLTYDVMFY